MTVPNSRGMSRYRLQSKELQLLTRMAVALPRIAPFERIRRAGEFLVWRYAAEQPCAECGQPCVSTHDPARHRLCCESCYQGVIGG
jgi:hypothetical protein